ncbi:hypothetical protein [Propionibacterium australiense]|uniref:Uncharacterized protein n=1 Tax=Propionibacterium australiense TaxID=119981 RepID=A0A8B3FUT5_9ACTN|nr:hypothetical protein [Propionibacterium australiense]RLP12230.1 hypothetical protein D7U36_02940 [Propionibacterium australiense]
MSELTFTEMVHAVTTIDRCANRAAALSPKLQMGRASVRANLTLALDLADRLRKALPDRVKTSQPMANRSDSLRQAVVNCRLRLQIVAEYQAQLENLLDEAALLTLAGRATALAEVIAEDAKTGLDLCPTGSEGVES